MGVSYLCSKKKGKEMGKRKSMKGTGLKSLLVVDILGTSDSSPLKDSAQLRTGIVPDTRTPHITIGKDTGITGLAYFLLTPVLNFFLDVS